MGRTNISREKIEIRRRLLVIKDDSGFFPVFEWAFANTYLGFSSPKSCADAIVSLAPKSKREIAERGRERLQGSYPGNSWYRAGD